MQTSCILTFDLTYILTAVIPFYRSSYLTYIYIYAEKLSYILPDVHRHIFWNSICFFLALYLTHILTYFLALYLANILTFYLTTYTLANYPTIFECFLVLSVILPGILSNTLLGILSGIHPAFYQTYIQTFRLTVYLAYILHVTKHTFWHSNRHSICIRHFIRHFIWNPTRHFMYQEENG